MEKKKRRGTSDGIARCDVISQLDRGVGKTAKFKVVDKRINFERFV